MVARQSRQLTILSPAMRLPVRETQEESCLSNRVYTSQAHINQSITTVVLPFGREPDCSFLGS